MSSNPLDYHVHQILENANFLSSDHVVRLREILPREAAGPGKNRKMDLGEQLERQMSILERLQTKLVGSEDVTEIKQIMVMSREFFSQLAKYKDQIEAEEKVAALEASIIETLSEFPEEHKKQFLAAWRKKIAALEAGVR